MNLALTIIATLFGAGLFYWAVSRVAPRGTVLGIAVVLYALGQGLDTLDAGVRIVSFASGILKMSGFLGIILGAVDLLRKRETAESVEVEIVEANDRPNSR